MDNFKTVDEVLLFAIQQEEASLKLYTELSKKIFPFELRELFKQFANEEKKHIAILQAIDKKKLTQATTHTVTDLKISDFLVEVTSLENMTYQKALTIAIQREKSAFNLYMELASKTEDEKFKNLFINLAKEEANHKLKYEKQYDDDFLMSDV